MSSWRWATSSTTRAKSEVISEIGQEDPAEPDYQLPICGWRGYVRLMMTPTVP
jgi:hypothetical protein